MKERYLVAILVVAVILFAVYHLLPDEFAQESDAVPTTVEKHGRDPLGAERLSFLDAEPNREQIADKFPEFREQWFRLFSGAVPNDYNSLAAHYKMLKQLAKQSDPKVVARFIDEFLASGRNTTFNSRFQIGLDGQLVAPPDARTAALDLLGDTDLDVVEKVSRQVLEAQKSQDEYALALRNLAWMSDSDDPDADYSDEISSYFTKMLDKTDWISNPSRGFYEALDVGVEIGAAKDLESLISIPDADPNLTRAAQIALDRIMLQQPDVILSEFQKNPDFLSVEPVMRAQMLARIDVRDAEQATFLEQYFKNPNVSSKEKDEFLAIFPNANFHFGPRMVTENEDAMAMKEVDEKDFATIDYLRGKINNPSTDPQVKTYYSKALKNLERFYPPSKYPAKQ